MARTPRTLISKTTGQGTSRYSYQAGYQLGNRGTGGGPLKDAPMPKLKGTGKIKPAFGTKELKQASLMNISYGDTWGDGTL